jgi:hypothetical protein
MDLSITGRVFDPRNLKPERLPSGLDGWLLVEFDNLALNILESKTKLDFSVPKCAVEEVVYVVKGYLEYSDGRIARAGEALVNVPDTPQQGSYVGKLASFRVRPETHLPKADPDLAKRVIKVNDIVPIQPVPGSRRYVKVIVVTGNFSLALIERETTGGVRAKEVSTSHPEKEIIYMLQGQLTYDNGRVLNPGRAIVNLSNFDHPNADTGEEYSHFLEMKVPPLYAL